MITTFANIKSAEVAEIDKNQKRITRGTKVKAGRAAVFPLGGGNPPPAPQRSVGRGYGVSDQAKLRTNTRSTIYLPFLHLDSLHPP